MRSRMVGRSAVAALVALVAGLVAVAPGSSAQSAGSCDQPYLPFFEEGPFFAPDPPLPPTGPSIAFADRPGPDTDGDGKPDDFSSSPDGRSVILDRGDGRVILATASGIVSMQFTSRGPLNLGDLDGDGHDELHVVSYPRTGPTVDYVVPGTVPPGTHDPADVGIALPEGSYIAAVGDQDGDGTDDVDAGGFEPRPGPGEAVTAELRRGMEIIAPGPGGRLSALPPPFRTIDGGIGGLLLLEGTTPTPIQVRQVGDHVELTVLTDPPVRLRSDRVVVQHDVGPNVGGAVIEPAGNGGTLNEVGGYHLGSERFVSFGQGSRSGSTVWIWDLDQPCSRYEPPTTTTVPVRPPTCREPLRPVFSGLVPNATSGVPPGVTGDIAVVTGPPVFDLDGDGEVDDPPYDFGPSVLRSGIGDLDGDGRDDVLVEDTSAPGGSDLYVVSGTTPPGTYEPAAVGVRLPYRDRNQFRWVGDQDGDGADDIAVGDEVLVSGRQLLAPAAGGTAMVQFSQDLGGRLLAVVEVEDGPVPELVVGRNAGGGAILTLGLRSPIQLTTDGVTLVAPVEEGQAEAYVGPAGRFITFIQSTVDGGTPEWAWNLDDPTTCQESPATTVPEAPAAQPVTGRPTFTG